MSEKYFMENGERKALEKVAVPCWCIGIICGYENRKDYTDKEDIIVINDLIDNYIFVDFDEDIYISEKYACTCQYGYALNRKDYIKKTK